jgi:hypothetical protein
VRCHQGDSADADDAPAIAEKRAMMLAVMKRPLSLLQRLAGCRLCIVAERSGRQLPRGDWLGELGETGITYPACE